MLRSRRNFLKHLGAITALLLTKPYSKAFSHSLNTLRQSHDLIMRTIPSSGEVIPAMGLGTARAFDEIRSPRQHADLREVLRLFYELGGRVVDSSPVYGNAEGVVGLLAGELGINEKLFMATKVWARGRRSGIRQMNTSFDKLRVEVMGLMQVHNFIDWKNQLPTLREWKEEGRIRYVGVSHGREETAEGIEQIMRTEPLDFVQLNYSLTEPQAEERLLPLAREKGMAVLANRPFAARDFFQRVKGKSLPPWAEEIGCQTWAQFALKYVISHPAVTCAIPATGKPNHLLDNMTAGTGRMPDKPTRRKMASYFNSI